MSIFCTDKIYPESREIWKNLLDHNEIQEKIVSMRRSKSASSVLLSNSMISVRFEHDPTLDNLLLLLISIHDMINFALDVTRSFKLFEKSKLIRNEESSNIILLILAKIMQNISSSFLSSLLPILNEMIIMNKFGNDLILDSIFDGLIQTIAHITISKEEFEVVEKLMNYIKDPKRPSRIKTDSINIKSYIFESNIKLANIRDEAIFAENSDDIEIKLISNQSEMYFWTSNYLFLRGLFHSRNIGYPKWKIALDNLIKVSKENEELKSSLVMSFLYKLSISNNPRVKLDILQSMIELGKSTEIFGTIKALSNDLIRSLSIELFLRVWKIEPRAYPFLHKLLVEKSSNDNDDIGLEIARASAIKQICELRPTQNGPDLVGIISEIINSSLEQKDGEIPIVMAIQSIILLCQNHVINIISTWKAINIVVKSEKRPRVIKSLCNFYAIIPQLKRTNIEYENFMKDILARLWEMIQHGSLHEIKCALEAMKSWSNILMTFDSIPTEFCEGIKIPIAPQGMEVSLQDLEVPGECFVQLLMKVHPDTRSSVSSLLIHYIENEISEFRSGHYIVKDGQPEPFNYHTLSKQSILKALIAFLIHQAKTEKSTHLVEEKIVLEALKIISHKYLRILPPLNWTLLSEFMSKIEKSKTECLKIAAKQSKISGTAKVLIENFLISLNEENQDDVENAMSLLNDCCNGISSEVLRRSCEKIFQTKDQRCLKYFEKFLEKEKDVTNRENFQIVISCFLLYFEFPIEFAKFVPAEFYELIASKIPQNNIIKFRFEMISTSMNIEDQIRWTNVMINVVLRSNQNIEKFKDLLFNLLSINKIFPRKRFLDEIMIMTQNRMVEENFEKHQLHFLMEIFIISVVSFSGYYEILSKNENILEKNEIIQIFPQSLELVSRQKEFEMSKIFEFILHLCHDEKLDKNIRQIFIISIQLCKNHEFFNNSKIFKKCLDLVNS